MGLFCDCYLVQTAVCETLHPFKIAVLLAVGITVPVGSAASRPAQVLSLGQRLGHFRPIVDEMGEPQEGAQILSIELQRSVWIWTLTCMPGVNEAASRAVATVISAIQSGLLGFLEQFT